MVMLRRSVNLTTPFLGQAWLSDLPVLRAIHVLSLVIDSSGKEENGHRKCINFHDQS